MHIELEKISLVFPSASDVFKIPKGFKLKNVLKKLSRDSIAAVAANQCGRRSFIEAELSTLNKLILVVPGVIAPKFPMLIAAAAVAKSEIEAYFCHVEGFAVRKDTKGQYDGKKFASPDICILLSTLYQTVSIVRKYQQLIIDYYTEYLVVNDLGKITKYCEACAESLNTLAPYFEAFVSDISELENAPVVCGNDNDYRSNHHIAHKNLEALRYNWERVLALSSGQQMALLVKSTESFDALRERISAVVIRSLYIDSMEILLKNFFDPYNIGWHRKVLLQSFTTTYKDPHGLAIHSFAYFKPLESVQLNTHLDCPEESKAIGESAKAVSNLMLNDMCAYLLTLLKYLWDYVSALESHCHPVEAAKRLEKAMLMKKGNEGGQVASAFESLPGTESEFWAKESIEKFVFIRRNLSLLMAAAEKIDKIQVYTREYFPSVFFLKHITKYFQARFNSVFTVGDRMNRPSLCLDKIICGCRAVQYVLGFIDADISLTMKEFLFTQFNDLLIAPPGVPTPLDVELAGTTVIYKIANSFVDFVNSIRALDSCLLYVPSQESFVNAVKKKYLKREDYDKASPLSLDLHLDREELAKLATIIGAQGVRAIDSQLLNMVTSQVSQFLKTILIVRQK